MDTVKIPTSDIYWDSSTPEGQITTTKAGFPVGGRPPESVAVTAGPLSIRYDFVYVNEDDEENQMIVYRSGNSFLYVENDY